MEIDIFLLLAPFIIAVLFGIIFYYLYKIYTVTKLWKLQNFLLITSLFMLFYLWVGIFQPDPAWTRTPFRILIISSLSNIVYIVYSYNKKITNKKGEK